MSRKLASTTPSDADKTREQLLAELGELRSRNAVLKKSRAKSTNIQNRPRNRVEEEYRGANRALKALSKCKEAMIRAEDEAVLLNDICRIIVDIGGYRMAWIGYIENDEVKTVRPVARAGYDEGYVDNLKIALEDPVRGSGPTGICLKTGKPYGSRNVQSDEEMGPWREEALKRGYYSTLNLPIVYEKQVIGALVIYSGKVDAFDEEERGLLFELAQTLAYGITAMRDRVRRTRAEAELRQANNELERRVIERTEELIKTNEALRKSEANLVRAQHITHLGNWDWDLKEDKAFCSDEFYRVFGLDRRDYMTYGQFIDTLCTRDRDRVNQAVEAALYKGEPYSIDYCVIWPDGSEHIIHAEGQVTYGQGGEPVKTFGIVQDITERKRAEEDRKRLIRELGERVKELGALHGVYDIMQKGRSVPEVLQDIADILPQAWQYPEVTAARIVLDGQEHKTSNFLETPWKQWADFRTTCGKHGAVEVYYLEKRPDEAEGPFLSEERELINSLAEMLRTYLDKWYAEEALTEAKNQAELYLDLMGHDINNMNQIALGYLELAIDAVKDDEVKEIVKKPLDAIQNSSKLIENVRKLQKVKAGGLKIEAIDLDGLLAELRDQYLNVPSKDVAIDYEAGRDCYVMANGLLRDVFSNLIGNAIKHSGSSKSVRIGLGLERVKEDGRDYCRVIVDDDGPGIPDTIKDKVFARFRKENAKAGGRGLGLYLVKSLLEDFHGTVHVEDRVYGDHTKGARFVVMLPAFNR